MPKQRSWTKEELTIAVKESSSIRQVLEKIHLAPAGGNYKQVQKYIKELGLDTSHFTGQGWSKGKRIDGRYKIPLEEVLVENSTFNSNHLRKRLLKEGIFEHRCSNCHNEYWQGVSIPLELEHKNGNNRDNRLENLCLLCPNCHALTDTYRGKNKGAYPNWQRKSV